MNCVLHSASDDGRRQIKRRPRDQTVLLTPLEMAELFDVTKQKISLHLKNLFAEGASGPTATAKESLTDQIKHSRKIQRPINLYNLDAILAVGDRVLCPDTRPV